MAREFGEVFYTLTDLLIAAYDDVAGTWDTPETVEDGQMFVAEIEADNDKLRGYGANTRGLSVLIGSKIKFKAGGVDWSILEKIAGTNITLSGTAGNQKRTVRQTAGGAGLGYFGAIGVAATDDGGLVAVGHRAVKLDTFPAITMDGETNKFSVWETEGYSFVRSAELFVAQIFEDKSDWDSVKPTDGATFAAFFA